MPTHLDMEQVHKFNDSEPLIASPRHAKLFNILNTQAPEETGELRDIRQTGYELSEHEMAIVQRKAIDSFSRRSALPMQV